MKILVRNFDNDGTCTYVWKKIRSTNPFKNGNYFTEDGCNYNMLNILKISHDYRKSDYVQCSVCGKVIKRDKIDQHYEYKERNADCVKCDWFRVVSNDKASYTIRKDGLAVSKTIGVPYCSMGSYYRGKKLCDVDKVSDCKHFACRRGGIRELPGDFFSLYPNPYKELLTENAMIEKGWKFDYLTTNGRVYCFDGKLTAHFDKNGILMYFDFLHRGSSYSFMYSDVYDKTVTYNGPFSWYGISERTKERYMKKIRELYR